MHARDGLHPPPIAVIETHPVDVLHAPGIGRAVASNRDEAVVFHRARHARSPEQLILRQHGVSELMHFVQELQHFFRAVEGRRDELGQGFRVVRGDVGMRQRRAPGRRVGGLGDAAVAAHAQTLFLEPALAGAQPRSEPRTGEFVDPIGSE